VTFTTFFVLVPGGSLGFVGEIPGINSQSETLIANVQLLPP